MAVFVEEILFFLRGCDFVVVVVILRVVVSCGVLTLWVCTERKGGSVFSQSKVSTREREERERIERNGEKKILKKKRTKSFWLLVLLCFFCVDQPSEVGSFPATKIKTCVFGNLLSRRAAECEYGRGSNRARALRDGSPIFPEDNTRDQSRASHLVRSDGNRNVLRTSGFSLLTPSGSAIFALVKAKRWWCPAKSFALWIFKSQSVHKNARSSRQTTETGLDLQISHGISFASCCVISIARSRDGLHFLVVTQRLHAVLFPHPTTNVASCGHISHFNFIVCS